MISHAGHRGSSNKASDPDAMWEARADEIRRHAMDIRLPEIGSGFRCGGCSERALAGRGSIDAGDNKKCFCVALAGIVKPVRGIGIEQNGVAFG